MQPGAGRDGHKLQQRLREEKGKEKRNEVALGSLHGHCGASCWVLCTYAVQQSWYLCLWCSTPLAWMGDRSSSPHCERR